MAGNFPELLECASSEGEQVAIRAASFACREDVDHPLQIIGLHGLGDELELFRLRNREIEALDLAELHIGTGIEIVARLPCLVEVTGKS